LQIFGCLLHDVWTVSITTHSSNLKLVKTPKAIKLGLLKNLGLTPKNPNPITPTRKAISRAMECHLSYGITQCYLPPDTGKRVPP